MSSMEMIFLMLVCLLGGLWETEAITVTGELEKAITIKCSHVNAFSNVKYFCKGTCKNEDMLIRSTKEKEASNDKYSIRDDGNTFYVTISHLTDNDSGTYWCGIDRYGIDTYNEIILTVVEGNKSTPETPQTISNTKASSSKKLVYIGAGLGVVVLALAMVLLIFFRHRSRDISASPGKVQDTVYATPFCQKQDAHHITTSSSTINEHQETDGRTNNICSSSSVQHQDNVFTNVTVSSASEIQPDSLLYSTVSFDKHTDCTVTVHTAAVTYSAINYITTDESAVYCNVGTQS
ncbi:CMRF35-like molecule 7 isoform X1 [Dicentrarchus labrax]|uniref:Immunoglobulin V-set domain-containing protein n=1 Tax=Dicentrarchus labrax TaxID=13489 RepID=A0A8P4FZJ8_DICLA|nr:CMRF35-like molecule 7 isoform X1 [Dicentrarchus labrax]